MINCQNCKKRYRTRFVWIQHTSNNTTTPCGLRRVFTSRRSDSRARDDETATGRESFGRLLSCLLFYMGIILHKHTRREQSKQGDVLLLSRVLFIRFDNPKMVKRSTLVFGACVLWRSERNASSYYVWCSFTTIIQVHVESQRNDRMDVFENQTTETS